MSLAQWVQETVEAAGVNLRLVDGRLALSKVDKAKLTPDTLKALRDHKWEIVRLLSGAPHRHQKTEIPYELNESNELNQTIKTESELIRLIRLIRTEVSENGLEQNETDFSGAAKNSQLHLKKGEGLPAACNGCSFPEKIEGEGFVCIRPVEGEPGCEQWQRIPGNQGRCDHFSAIGGDKEDNDVGFTWCKNHEPELLAAGWTRDELFKAPPALDCGIAFIALWTDPAVTVELGKEGQIIFTISRHGKTVKQVGRPMNHIS